MVLLLFRLLSVHQTTMINSHVIACLFGDKTPTAEEEQWIAILRGHLLLDNNKLREHLICALFGITPTNGYKGRPDGEKDGVFYDVKSHNLSFPDGGRSIRKKQGWVCLICDYSAKDGLPTYVVEVPFDCVYKELSESAKQKESKGGRVTPSIPWGVWANKPESKVIFKRPETFPRKKDGTFTKRFAFIDSMPFENKLVK